MKGIFVTAAACGAIAISGLAVAKAPPSPTAMKLTLAGEDRWSVRCTLDVGNGLINREEFKGGKSTPVVFSTPKLNFGTCDYKAAPDKPLTITIEGDAWACPLTAPTNEKCEQQIAPGASGSLRLTQRATK